MKEWDVSQGGTVMKAKVKATGKVVSVQDYGEKFHPRFWDNKQGYDADELDFVAPRRVAKLTTPPAPRQCPGLPR